MIISPAIPYTEASNQKFNIKGFETNVLGL